MIIPDGWRLVLYIGMSILPIWSDFVAKSSDYSFRGLLMPILASLNAGVVVALAKTAARMDGKPIEVTAPAGHPLPVIETKKETKK